MADHSSGLFSLNPNARASIQLLGGQVPILLIDDVLQDPAAVRASALALEFAPPDYPYPGELAQPDDGDRSLQAFERAILALVNREYLPRIPPIAENERRITSFARVETDFAVTNVHPDDLSPVQREPHVDPVPIFGLIYLNRIDRGGTLFFNRSGRRDAESRAGYFAAPNDEYEFVGKIEGKFNRLAIYPGFVPHTGEIAGDWITTDERFTEPRLTLRLVFFP